MSFRVGEYVVYASNEVCVYSGIVTKCFDGKNKIDYCMLEPVYSHNSAYYVPCDKIGEKIRPVLSKEEISETVDRATGKVMEWNSDKNARKLEFNAILKSNDFEKIFIMLKTIYEKKNALESKGKKLFAVDERTFSEAERLIRQEFSIVLDIKENEVEGYVQKLFGN